MCFEEVGLICLGKVAIWKPWWRINQGSGDNGSINNRISCGFIYIYRKKREKPVLFFFNFLQIEAQASGCTRPASEV